MKKRNYIALILVASSFTISGWWGGSSYTPSYQGGGGGGYITPSRFAPYAYTKNTGWDSGDGDNCHQTVVYETNQYPVKKEKRTRVIIKNNVN